MKRSMLVKLMGLFLGISISLFIFLNTIGLDKIKETVLDKKKECLYEYITAL